MEIFDKTEKIMLGGAISSFVIGEYHGINGVFDSLRNIPPDGLEGIISSFVLVIPGITAAADAINRIEKNKEKIQNKLLYPLKIYAGSLLDGLETSIYLGISPYVIGICTGVITGTLIKNFN